MRWIFKNENLSCERLLRSSFEVVKNEKVLEKNQKKIKNKLFSRGNKLKIAFAVLFLAFAFFVSSGAKAADTIPSHTSTTIGKTEPISTSTTAGTSEFQKNGALADPNGTKVYAQPTGQNAEKCGITDITCNFKVLLVGVFNVVGWLFGIAATIFAWAIKPENISGSSGLLNKQAVKDVWMMVRDILNMAFILVLLFAAFCTIFQVDKWSLKKVWLNILINALLVNFSFPIARFFIDVSNVAFYYFASTLFSTDGAAASGSSIMAGIGAASRMGKMLVPQDYTNFDISYIIALIIIAFIMGMTLLIIAALFIVRLIALTMIVMFAPIGFVGYIFPSTGKYADKWWTNLFSYSFFAPIMLFVMSISVRITQAIGQDNFQSFLNNASQNVSKDGDASWIANAAFYSIPILLLWTGIGIAKSFSIAGADTVTKNVKAGGKWLANFPLRATGVSGGAKMWWDSYKKKGVILGSETLEKRAAWWNQGLPFGDKSAYRNLRDKKVKETAEKAGYDQMSAGEKRSLLKTENDEFKRAALIKSLAEDGTAGEADLKEVLSKFGEKSLTFKQLQSKIASYNTAAAFSYIGDEKTRRDRKEAYMDSNKYKPKDQKLGALQSPEDLEIAITSGNASLSDLDDQRKKSTQHGKAIDGTLKQILQNPAHTDVVGDDPDHEKHRKLQLAFLAQTGKLHDSLSGLGQKDKRKAVFDNVDKDSMKRMIWEKDGKPGMLQEFGYELLNGIKQKNIKEAIASLAPNEKRKFLHEVVMRATASDVPEIDAIKDMLKNDPEMKRWVALNRRP